MAVTPGPRIVKVGLCLIRAGRVILDRSRGQEVHQIPGGKPEAGDTDLDALARETREFVWHDIRASDVVRLRMLPWLRETAATAR